RGFALPRPAPGLPGRLGRRLLPGADRRGRPRLVVPRRRGRGAEPRRDLHEPPADRRDRARGGAPRRVRGALADPRNRLRPGGCGTDHALETRPLGARPPGREVCGGGAPTPRGSRGPLAAPVTELRELLDLGENLVGLRQLAL